MSVTSDQKSKAINSWLHNDLEASLSYMRPYFKVKKKIKVEQSHEHTATVNNINSIYEKILTYMEKSQPG